MVTQISIVEARIIAFFLESIFYGIYLVTLGGSINVLLFKKINGIKRRLNWSLIIVTAALATFITVDVVTALCLQLQAFVFYQGPGGSAHVFEDISFWANVMRYVCTQTLSLIFEGMLVYRCLVVWYYRYLIIVIPFILWLGNLACSIMIIFIVATLRTSTTISASELKPFVTSFIAISTFTVLLTTGLIAYRIWSVTSQNSTHGVISTGPSTSRLSDVNRIIIESGFMTDLILIIGLIVYVVGSNAVYVTADLTKMIFGIAFNLIIIRVDKDPFNSSNGPTADRAPPISLEFANRRTGASTYITQGVTSSATHNHGISQTTSGTGGDLSSTDVESGRGVGMESGGGDMKVVIAL